MPILNNNKDLLFGKNLKKNQIHLDWVQITNKLTNKLIVGLEYANIIKIILKFLIIPQNIN
jgi:hypothetical protein